MIRRLTTGVLLTLLLLITASGCGGRQGTAVPQETVIVAESGTVLGEGAVGFPLTITDPNGQEILLEIHTNEETVGEALEAIGLIAGEEGPYGLYVKTVNGLTLDYNTDGFFWSFYINDQYASAGVDATQIQPGDSYALRAEQP